MIRAAAGPPPIAPADGPRLAGPADGPPPIGPADGPLLAGPADGPPPIGAGGLPLPPRLGLVCVKVLMSATVRAKWSTDKVQFHGDSVVRFGPGPTAVARPRPRRAAAFPAGNGPPRGDPGRPAAGWRAAAVIPGTRP